MFRNSITALLIAAVAVAQVYAETHFVSFTNNCGYGTPYLWGPDGALYSTGDTVEFEGEARGLIAYLQTGGCGNDGEGCTLVEASLINGASSADISLIAPHEFSVASGYGYYDGCDGAGADCTYDGCPVAFYEPDQPRVLVGCSADNVSLAITFCD